MYKEWGQVTQFISLGYWSGGTTWIDGDYHLRLGSPCIDSGDSSAIPQDVYDIDDNGDTIEQVPFDLDGNPRLSNGTWGGVLQIDSQGDTLAVLSWNSNVSGKVDMGAYEHLITYTLQSCEAIDTGSWQNRFIGNVGTWTDTDTADINKRFYRVGAE